MDKGDVVKFGDLQIGDYFSDDAGQKCRKIPPVEFPLSDPPVMLNAFYIQIHARVSLDPDREFIFIKHAPWIEQEDYGFSLSVEESELGNQLEFLRDYLETLEGFLSSHAETESVSFDDPSYKQKIYEFIDLLRSSFLVSLYSYLETRLVNECRQSQHDNPSLKLSFDDINGRNIIKKAETYLVKVLDTSFPFDTDPHWKEIHWYNQIRNCIVHKEGKVFDKELKKYIESHSDISLVQAFGNDYLILSNSFCEKALSTISTFLTSLLYHRQADKII